MTHRQIAPWLMLTALAAIPVSADVDIPTAVACGDTATNSVTDSVYTRCGPDLVEIDGATHAQRSLAVSGQIAGIDPVHNRVVTWTASSVTVVDVPSWNATVHALSPGSGSPSGSPVALDPASDAIWVVEPAAGRVVRVVGTTGVTTPVSLGTTGTNGFATIDPVQGFVYAGLGGPSFVEIDIATLGTRTITVAPPVTGVSVVGVDPIRRRVWATGAQSDAPSTSMFYGIDAVNGVVDAVNGTPLPFFGWSAGIAVDPGNDRVWQHFASGFDGGSITLLDGDGAALDVREIVAFNGGATASPANGRAYVGYGWTPDGDAGLAVMDATPIGGRFEVSISPLPLSNYSAGVPAVMFSTNKVYVPYRDDVDPVGAKAIREVDEAETDPIPLPVVITRDVMLPDNSVLVRFEASSGFPTPLPIAQVYYQLDSTDGAWTPAPQAGPSASVVIQFASGTHTVHAFAVDGQEATLSTLHRRNPVTGPIASLDVTFVPPACSNGIDDDGDGLVDHPDDPGCRFATSYVENPKCDDDLDNDGDGGIDWDGGSLGLAPDAQCLTTPWRDRENVATGGCGLGAEIALTLALLRAARGRARRPRV